MKPTQDTDGTPLLYLFGKGFPREKVVLGRSQARGQLLTICSPQCSYAIKPQSTVTLGHSHTEVGKEQRTQGEELLKGYRPKGMEALNTST